MQRLSYQQKTNTDSIRCYEIKYFLNLPLGKIPFWWIIFNHIQFKCKAELSVGKETEDWTLFPKRIQ